MWRYVYWLCLSVLLLTPTERLQYEAGLISQQIISSLLKSVFFCYEGDTNKPHHT